MNIQTASRDDHQTLITVEFEPELFERYKHRAARRIAQERKVPGFRPGKAPYEFIRRFFGDEAIGAQAIELLIDDQYPHIIEEAGIKPAAPGSLGDITSRDPLILEFIVPLEPEVILGDYKSIRKDYKEPGISNKDVEQVLKDMRYSYSTAVTKDDAAEKGDLVAIKMTATILNPSEGQDPIYLRDSHNQIVIEDEKKPNEQPFAGFSQELIGVKAGDEKLVSHKFPKTAQDPVLQGKKVEYSVSIESVKSLTLPELTDEFAQSVGEFETLDALKGEIRHQLEHERIDKYNDEYFEDLFKTIIEQSTIRYAPQSLDEEVESVIKSLERNLEREGLDLGTYLKAKQTDHDAFIEAEAKPVAKRRLEQSLVMEAVAREEGIILQPEVIEASYQDTVQALEASPEFKKRSRQEVQRLATRLALNNANRQLNALIMERLKLIATGKWPEKESPTTSEDVTTEVEIAQPVTPNADAE